MIPEIDVRTLTARKISEGTLAFSFEPEADLLEIPYVQFEGAVKAELTYRIFEDDSVEVAGRIFFALSGWIHYNGGRCDFDFQGGETPCC